MGITGIPAPDSCPMQDQNSCRASQVSMLAISTEVQQQCPIPEPRKSTFEPTLCSLQRKGSYRVSTACLGEDLAAPEANFWAQVVRTSLIASAVLEGSKRGSAKPSLSTTTDSTTMLNVTQTLLSVEPTVLSESENDTGLTCQCDEVEFEATAEADHQKEVGSTLSTLDLLTQPAYVITSLVVTGITLAKLSYSRRE